jgi:hypothetical protein
MIQLRKFDINIIKNHTVVIIGRRNISKYFLTKDILFYNQDLPTGRVISPTETITKFHTDIIPCIFIRDQDEDKI